MTLVETLERVRARLATPEKWTQRELARDAAGGRVDPWSHAAASWDLEGALMAEMDVEWGESYARFLGAPEALWVAEQLRKPITVWNDAVGRTHDDVLKALDVMIRRAPRTSRAA